MKKKSRKLKRRLRKLKRTPRVQKASLPGSMPGIANSTTTTEGCATVRLISYTTEWYQEQWIDSVDGLAEKLIAHAVNWIDVCGVTNYRFLKKLGKQLKIHTLALEDASNTHQVAKFEDYEHLLYIVLRKPDRSTEHDSEQINIFMNEKFIMTIHESPADDLNRIVERIKKPSSQLRQHSLSFLTYAIIDSIIDHYFPVLEEIADRLDLIEDGLIEGSRLSTPKEIYAIKKELTLIHHLVRGHSQVIYGLIRDKPQIIDDDVIIYLRDCYDHTVQQLQLIKSYQEFSYSLVDLSLSVSNQQTNEIMKFLTLIATIFIPLTFIAGIYGMNFDTHVSPFNMPELKFYYGYPLVLGFMLFIAGSLIWLFKRRGWL